MNTLPPPPSSDEWELDVEDAFGEHDIEYWVWSGNRLVPAMPEQIAIIHEREALSRLRAWTASENQRTRERVRRARFGRWAARLRRYPARVLLACAVRFRSASPTSPDVEPNPAQTGTSGNCSNTERPVL